ncbi:MAG: hypothetical protein CR988_06025 [Treponema sp.]|nr:MAG: hypothetical protein CR988_06025 [Treponema sp.]
MKKFTFIKAFLGVLSFALVLFSCNQSVKPTVSEQINNSAKPNVTAKISGSVTKILENNTVHSNEVVMHILRTFIKNANIKSDGCIKITFDNKDERNIITRNGSHDSDEHECNFEFVFYEKKKHKHSTGFWPWQWEWCTMEIYKDECTICGKKVVVEYHDYDE